MIGALKKEDFTYANFKDALKGLGNFINEFEYVDKGMAKAEVDWVISNIGMPNNLTVMIGYGLFTQRDILKLRLENARLEKKDRQYIADLESELSDMEEQVITFLKEYYWVD